jgi:hypothetical protein
LVNNLINQTQTKSRLKVFSSILDKAFETGRKYSEGFKENMKIQFDDYLGNWNYVAIPQNC